MASTQTQIANAALRAVGQDRIASFATGGEAGRVLDDIYEKKVEYLLRHHLWNFSIKRDSIPESAASPDWEFDHAYPVPADCIRVISTSEDVYAHSLKWQLEGQSIVTDITSPLKIKYVSRAPESEFDPLFEECLVALLAAELAQVLTGDLALQQELQGEAERKLRMAKGADGQEGSPPVFRRGTWLSAKWNGAGSLNNG